MRDGLVNVIEFHGKWFAFQVEGWLRIDIGSATPVNNRRFYRNPHMEEAWLADGFNFQAISC